MGGFTEYTDYDAPELAELVRTRQLSAEELLEAAIGPSRPATRRSTRS